MGARLAIEGGTPVRERPFPSWPVWGDEERVAVAGVINSGHWGELTGSRVQAFEDRFAAFQDARHGLAVPNGTQALEVGLQALGVGAGDEVITSAFTFIATISAMFAVGAKPVCVDVDPATNLIDPDAIEAAITSRTKAIVPVHIGGQPCDLDAIVEIGRRHGIPVLEDAAQAVGAAWRGTKVGAIGDIGTFSFQETKNLSGGEGGALVTNRDDLQDVAWSVHNSGRGYESGAFDFERMGGNYRMPELTAGLLLAQMDRLPAQMETRDRSAAVIAAGLVEVPGFEPTVADERVTRHAWHLYQIRYDPAHFGGRSREDTIAALWAEGVPAGGGYIPLTHIPAIRTAIAERFGTAAVTDLPEVPQAAEAGRNTIWLTQNMLLGSETDAEDIVQAFGKVARAWGC
jgi:dTDP-4-amino-4,6-dideoxygalactose transaminase